MPTITELQLAKFAQEFNKCVAVMFPPHPAASAPSSEAGVHHDLPKDLRSWVNKDWGKIKQCADRRYNIKNR